MTIWFSGAQNKTRTCTPLPAPAPQAGVSTNFTIWAMKGSGHKGLKAQRLNCNKPEFLKKSKELSGCKTVAPLCHYTIAPFSAQNRTRTCTSSLTLVPETSASTNFAIWACL